jgi:hypothetical protein
MRRNKYSITSTFCFRREEYITHSTPTSKTSFLRHSTNNNISSFFFESFVIFNLKLSDELQYSFVFIMTKDEIINLLYIYHMIGKNEENQSLVSSTKVQRATLSVISYLQKKGVYQQIYLEEVSRNMLNNT